MRAAGIPARESLPALSLMGLEDRLDICNSRQMQRVHLCPIARGLRLYRSHVAVSIRE